MKHLLRLAPVLLLLPSLASADVVWRGDFETGNLSQWTRTQSVSSDRLLVVSDVVREGRYALKATVRRGDDPIRSSGNRNELLYLGLEPSGSEYFYKWSTRFPTSFPRSDSWQVFAQWHHLGCCGSPPLELYIIDDEMRLRAGGASGPVLWRAPVERERWHDFILHVKWSSDPRVGFVELYKDGQLVMPKRMVATQFRGDRNYLKLGLYRDERISPEGVLYHDGFIQATRLEDVLPPPAVAPPEPQPEPVVTPAPPPEPVVAPAPQPPAPAAPESPGVVVSPTPPLPEGPGTQPGEVSAELPPGCGASAAGGMPVLAASGLLLAALLRRRRARR